MTVYSQTGLGGWLMGNVRVSGKTQSTKVISQTFLNSEMKAKRKETNFESNKKVSWQEKETGGSVLDEMDTNC